MSLRYYIDGFNGTEYKLYIEIDQINSNEAKNFLIKKEPGHSPDSNIFPLFDKFDGSLLNTDKWNVQNVPILAKYSVSNKLNLWNNWGGCCSSACYYRGIESVQTFKEPTKIVYHFDQENYEPSTSCARTGSTVALKDKLQVVPSTDIGTNQGLNIRVNDSQKANKGDAFPNSLCKIEIFAENEKIRVVPSWDDTVNLSDSLSFTNTPIVLSGDTDSSTVIDHIYKIFAFEYEPNLSITTSQVDDNTYKIRVHNNSANNLTNTIIEVDLGNFITSESESLNIYNFDVKVLFAKSDNSVHYWNGLQWVQIASNINSLTQHDFDKYGMKTPISINKTQIQQLDLTPYVLMNNPNFPIINGLIDGTPTKKLFVMKEPISTADWDTINSFTLKYSGVYTGKIKFLVSNSRYLDRWYAYDISSNTWNLKIDRQLNVYDITDTNDVYNHGNDKNEASSIDLQSINTTGFLSFAFVIEDRIELDGIVFNVNTKEYFDNDTHNHSIKLGQQISITFSSDGYYKIVYFD